MIEYLRLIFDLSPDLIAVARGDGYFRVWNPAWAKRLGFHEDDDLSAIRFVDLIHPDDLPDALPPGGTKHHVADIRLCRKDESYLRVEWHTFPVYERDEIYLIGRDITSRAKLEERLRQIEVQFDDLVENAADAIGTVDIEGRLISINRAAERISGYAREEAIGRPFSDFVDPAYHAALKQMTGLRLSGQASSVFEVDLITKDGRHVPIELNTHLRFENGQPAGIQGIARDIRVRKKLTEELQQRNRELESANSTIRSLLNQDPLTKLDNRRSMQDTLEKAVSLARRSGQPLSVVIGDLDHFKQINDNFGHAVGDEVLARFGALLGSTCRREDTAARYGGEEFLILLPNTTMKDARDFAERIRIKTAALRATGDTGITVSFGVTQFVADDTADSFISRADTALYLAKERGRNCVEFR